MKKEFKKTDSSPSANWLKTYVLSNEAVWSILSNRFSNVKSISSLLLELQYLTWISCTDLVYLSSYDFVLDGRIVNIS